MHSVPTLMRTQVHPHTHCAPRGPACAHHPLLPWCLLAPLSNTAPGTQGLSLGHLVLLTLPPKSRCLCLCEFQIVSLPGTWGKEQGQALCPSSQRGSLCPGGRLRAGGGVIQWEGGTWGGHSNLIPAPARRTSGSSTSSLAQVHPMAPGGTSSNLAALSTPGRSWGSQVLQGSR